MTRRMDPPSPEEIRSYRENLKSLSCSELEEWLSTGKPCTVVDVRTVEEWVARRIPGARHVPLHELEARLEEVLTLPGPLMIHCEHGMRSLDASLYLAWQGRNDVYNVIEGLSGWVGPTESG